MANLHYILLGPNPNPNLKEIGFLVEREDRAMMLRVLDANQNAKVSTAEWLAYLGHAKGAGDSIHDLSTALGESNPGFDNRWPPCLGQELHQANFGRFLAFVEERLASVR